jgi:hypothetical protein
MSFTLKKALCVILTSLCLALVFNFLFFGKMVGISVFVMASVLLIAVYLLAKQQNINTQKTWWLVLLIGFFALMPALRANEFLTFLNVCATLGLLMLLAHELVGTPVFLMKVYDYIVLISLVPFRMLERAWSALTRLGQIHSSVKHRDVWLRVIKGVIMAIPILLLFGLLFSKADLAFSQFVKGFIDINISECTVQYTALLIFAFVSALCFLAYIFMPKPAASAAQETKPETVYSGKIIEIMVFLGLIGLLFLLFIIFQIMYLFGGETNIINTGFTYAEYARRGFWELLAVAFLSLLILLVSEKYAGSQQKKDKRFLIPGLILIAEVMVVIVSAFKRLSLYIDTYGQTILRFYVAGFILLLLVLFILLAVKFIKAKQEQFFTFGTLLSVAGFLIVVNLINPDMFIIERNIEQYDLTGKIDVTYLNELSADATQGKIELYYKLGGEDKEFVRTLLLKDIEKLQQDTEHWESFNLSRFRALKILESF